MITSRRTSTRSAAKCSGDEVPIRLHDLTVMTGQLAPAKQRLLLAWAAIHKDELVRKWDLARQGLPHEAIAPTIEEAA